MSILRITFSLPSDFGSLGDLLGLTLGRAFVWSSIYTQIGCKKATSMVLFRSHSLGIFFLKTTSNVDHNQNPGSPFALYAVPCIGVCTAWTMQLHCVVLPLHLSCICHPYCWYRSLVPDQEYLVEFAVVVVVAVVVAVVVYFAVTRRAVVYRGAVS